MISVACCLWDANDRSQDFSRCYSEEWVERLYRGFARNLTLPFRFVVFTDRTRHFSEGIHQERLATADPHYGCCVEPFRLNEPMIFCGLDTVILGNIDHLAAWCHRTNIIGLPKHPYEPVAINGVVLAPAGMRSVFSDWRGENDMDWMRKQPHRFLDDLFPGQVVSYKAHVRGRGLPGDARIVYFHGNPKMQDAMGEPFVRDHWR